MGWLGDGFHTGQGRQAWTAVGLPPRYTPRKRREIGLWSLWGAHRKSPPGYRRHHLQPLRVYDHPFHRTGGSLPVKTCIANCGQTIRYDSTIRYQSLTAVVCIDNSTSYGEHMRSRYPTVPSSIDRRGSQKLNSKFMQNRNTRPVGTHWHPVWHHQYPSHRGYLLLQNLGEINMPSISFPTFLFSFWTVVRPADAYTQLFYIFNFHKV